ncbi:Plasma membrane permease, mediates uptake of glycerophosphoinositol and glycerophosphocholine [Lunasporangiospora selenospora]|uniref:Plasma membrane permease, mediates uptake of glycerophosphoinositol and glycerophosphocholine n=1 Tax=Lunasporangiospora selenospora TaxID=979761 RepID=A0A9P6KIR2_9FUNG|nr:Plasma membrane permease, mediates uptake of glycerophosphoinositol and glycerophosphocholine [Lunasporangiospora selenospora]
MTQLSEKSQDATRNDRSRLSAIFTVIFSGFALLSDGYQIGVLSLINVCFTKIYGDQFTSEISTRIGNSLFVGCILGQIGFGYVCDRVGRKMGLMLTTFLVILGAALCAGSYGANGSVEGLFWALTVYRGILGVGVGGEYPCSSASASEAADEVMPGRRGMLFVFVTNFVIDCGFVLSAMIPLILAAAGCSYEVIWRASFAFGVLPPLSVLYFRFKMDNSEIYQKNSMKKNVPYVFMMMGEFGPGDMLGLVSAEIYPTAIRGTAYGWSAAIGKFGAFVGTTVFKPAIATFGKNSSGVHDEILGQSRVFIMASCLALLGSVFTYFLIPDYSKKGLHEEDEVFRQYLADNGFDISSVGQGQADQGTPAQLEEAELADEKRVIKN